MCRCSRVYMSVWDVERGTGSWLLNIGPSFLLWKPSRGFSVENLDDLGDVEWDISFPRQAVVS